MSLVRHSVTQWRILLQSQSYITVQILSKTGIGRINRPICDSLNSLWFHVFSHFSRIIEHTTANLYSHVENNFYRNITQKSMERGKIRPRFPKTPEPMVIRSPTARDLWVNCERHCVYDVRSRRRHCLLGVGTAPVAPHIPHPGRITCLNARQTMRYLYLSSWSLWRRLLLFIIRLLSIVKIWSAVWFFWYIWKW